MSALRFGVLLLAAAIIAVTVIVLTSSDGNETEPQSYVGNFRSRDLPAASSAGPTVVLQVQDGGDLTVTSDYMNGEPPISQAGTWTTDGGVLVVTLRSQNGRAYERPVVVSFIEEGETIRTTGSGSEEMFGIEGLTLYRE